MLSSLHIRNYILIDALDVTFPDGLVIITGQTGAGKSIILGALSLLMGGKADASVISAGNGNCMVEGEFDLSSEKVREVLERNDIDWDGGHLIIRRTISSVGRSRSFINDVPVAVGVLSEISSMLIDIHSQHQSLMLSDKTYQLSVLDAFAGNGALLASCREKWKRLHDLRSELEDRKTRLASLLSEREYNSASLSGLVAAGLRDGELTELEEEQRTLANAEEIKSLLTGARELLNPSNDVSSPVSSSLKEAERCLSKAGPFLPAAENLVSRLESARIEIDDVLGEVETLDSSVLVSEERLALVEDRMSLLYELMRRHGVSSEAELIAVRDSLARTMDDTAGLEESIKETEKELSRTQFLYEQVCAELSASRAKAAPGLAAAILDKLHYLELDRALFDIRLISCAGGATGADTVVFLFDAAGKSLADVAKCASGGEISRIMLSIKAIMAGLQDMPVLVFDEIDTGVSGSVADRMGSVICRMAGGMQVFAITHLPQVVAKGRAHFLVSKTAGDKGDVSSIKELSPEERVMEIARMLSGAQVTPEAVANARTLLG